MQNRHHVLLRYKLWLTQITGKDILGEEKFGLLRNIKRLGSLSAAARAMGISYRKAWGDIREAEALIGYSLTIKERVAAKEDGRYSRPMPKSYSKPTRPYTGNSMKMWRRPTRSSSRSFRRSRNLYNAFI
ncbi:MAG: LysR family transcriptional regulator [Bacteroidales bacterium]|nr:LysR family transcriptional regulator [Bacteroidales bacterium]